VKRKNKQHVAYFQNTTGEVLEELSVMKGNNGGHEAFPLRR
jgi:hypothetical protein